MFLITLDTDWVPQFVLDHALEILQAEGLRATIFCTGPYRLPGDGTIEPGIHPNLCSDSTQGRDADEILDRLRNAWPKAVGCRSHRLYFPSGLPQKLLDRGFTYDSSVLSWLKPGLSLVNGQPLTRIPFWWGDMPHICHGLPLDRFEVPGMSSPGLKVLNIHPIHIYLNTNAPGDYRRVMDAIGNLSKATPEDLAPHRHPGHGIETLFTGILRFLAREQGPGKLLREVIEHASRN